MSTATATRPVLLITMGGPRDLAEVETYLRRLFSDPYILPGNSFKRWLLSRIIARAAAKKSRARYALIGGRSTAVEDTGLLAEQLKEDFASRGITLECQVATRYATPNIEEGLTSLSAETAEKDSDAVTPVYLFPHETSVMTGSCAGALERASDESGVPVGTGVRHLGATRTYARGWADAIERAVRAPGDTFVLFSCHSLPRTIIERGDAYVEQVERSVERIRARLRRLAGELAYQSQARNDWLGPTVEEVASEAYGKGYRELIVVPLSFVGENTETLVDLDRELCAAALSMGFRRVERLRTPDKLGFLCPMVVEALCMEWGLEWKQAQ